MRLIIFLGMLTVFISCFFMFFTFDGLVKSKVKCYQGEELTCDVNKLNNGVVFGIIVVGLFLFVDVLVVYLMTKTWVPGLFFYSGSAIPRPIIF